MTSEDNRRRGRKSRNKGKRGERELANILKERGYTDARRGQQYSGKTGEADVVGIPGYHIEVKRVEQFHLWDALEQSTSDARAGEIPIVIHRKNQRPWVVVMSLDNFLTILPHEED